jgi:ATP-dependent DNA helicase RecG
MRRLVRNQIDAGRQAFVICPEIDSQSGTADRTIANTTKTYREISRMFSDCSVGLLHSRIRSEERETTILRFRGGDIQILVATTLVEVGVDVPNATVMIIENADRFGLAQLHQLRGRVGRGIHESYCFLLAEPTTAEAARRMDIMTSTNDGFRIAEQDMLLRGPGEFLGAAQSGLPRLRVGHLVADSVLLDRARRAAAAVLSGDPRLESPENAPLRLLPGVCQLGTVHL